MKDLIELGLWNETMKNKLIEANGSVQALPEIPQNIKDIYKTVWEISQKSVIDMAADRGAYICQSQSMNIHLQNPNFGKMTSMHFYAWKKGLKTGMYYLRSKAATDAIKFTLDKSKLEQPQAVTQGAAVGASSGSSAGGTATQTQEAVQVSQEQKVSDMQCSLDDPDGCIACGS